VTAQPVFFTVSDSKYFVGTVALANSLRLTGNPGNLAVLDLGLTPDQRRRLGTAANVVDLPADVALRHPWFAKPLAHRFRSSGVLALIDSDMVAVRSLAPELGSAAAGKIVVFPSHEVDRDRWFAEWEADFALAEPLRRGRYLNSGFVALSLDRWPQLFPRWERACKRIPPEEVGVEFVRRSRFAGGDDDALNAILRSEVPESALDVRPDNESILHDALRNVDILDPRSLECSYRGRPPALLHFALRGKPWQWQAWRRARTDDAYMRLLPRLLFARDLPVRVEPEEVAVWLRPTRPGHAALRVLDLYDRLVGFVRDGNTGMIKRVAARLRESVAHQRA
jgi:hypothetical protein